MEDPIIILLGIDPKRNRGVLQPSPLNCSAVDDILTNWFARLADITKQHKSKHTKPQINVRQQV